MNTQLVKFAQAKMAKKIKEEVYFLNQKSKTIIFNFSEIDFPDDLVKQNDYSEFFENLQRNTTLTSLSFIDAGLTDDNIGDLFAALKDNTTLKILTICNFIEDLGNNYEWFDHLLLFMGNRINTLEQLNLPSMEMDEKCFEKLSNCLINNNNKTLKVLDVSYLDIEDIWDLVKSLVVNSEKISKIVTSLDIFIHFRGNNKAVYEGEDLKVKMDEALKINESLCSRRPFASALPDELERDIYRTLKIIILE